MKIRRIIKIGVYDIAVLIAVLIVMVIVFLTQMLIVYSIPTERMFSNAKQSKEVFSANCFTAWTPYIDSAKASYSTDAIMISCAIYSNKENRTVYNALMNPRYENGRGIPEQSLIEVLEYNRGCDILLNRSAMTKADSFKDEKNTTGELETMYYPRYWHGYLVLIKPLLLFFNISEIKMLSLMIFCILTAITLLLIAQKIGKGAAFSFLTMVIILNPITIVLNIAETTVYVLLLVVCDCLLARSDIFIERKNASILFIIIGGTTCFLDFLTYPLVTLGIPLALLVLIYYEDVKIISVLFRNSFAWGFGYAGSWLGKFGVCTILTDYDAFSYGIKSVVFRLGTGATSHSYGTSIYTSLISNVRVLMNWQSFAIILIVFSIIIVMLVKGYQKIICKKLMIALFIISLMPFIWYILLSNHSTIHYYFTYRELAITWFCVVTILLDGWKARTSNDFLE